MTGIPTGIAFDGIDDISSFEYVWGRGIEPGQCIIECLPQEVLEGNPGNLVITYDVNDYTAPSMAPVEQWLQQADTTTAEETSKPGFRMFVRLLDRRRLWKLGSITGLYNLRLADGTVYPNTQKEPAELATLCLLAMGEAGFDVSKMPTGVYPPILWDNANPAQSLDHLCRYVGCEITGGERGAVIIWPRGTGDELPDDGEYINPPFQFKPKDYPTEILLEGGLIVYQGKLQLKGHVIQSAVAVPLTPAVAADTNWPRESPWSLPGLTTSETREDAFESEFRQYPVLGLPGGANILPFCSFPITKPHQFVLKDYRLDTFTDLQLIQQNMPARVEGKFFPYGDDADSHTTITPFTGRFLIRQAGNIVEFPYPVWKLGTTGLIEEPELYLVTAFNLQKVDRDGFNIYSNRRALGGPSGSFVLKRHELFFAVKFSYAAGSILVTGISTTLPSCSNEAEKYLDIFQTALQNSTQIDREWIEIRDIKCTGQIAQVRYKGSVRDNDGGFTTRASQNFEFDIHGPTIGQQRVQRDVTSKLDRSCP